MWDINQWLLIVILGLFSPRHSTVPAPFAAKPYFLSWITHVCCWRSVVIDMLVYFWTTIMVPWFICPSLCQWYSLDNCGFIVSIFFVENSCEAIWPWNVSLCGKISNYKILLMDNGLFRLSISYMNFGCLCLLRNLSFLFVNLSCFYYFLIILLISVEFIIMSPPSFLIWLICSFFFFPWSLWLEMHQFHWSSQETIFGLIGFSVYFYFLFPWFPL